MSKTLPNIPANVISQIQNSASQIKDQAQHGPLHTFKSHINLKQERDAKVVVINNQLTLQLEANTSGTITVTFNHEFEYIPIVFYTIICNDDHFQLCHYIKEITPRGFICNIENEGPHTRSVNMIYRAM